MHFISVGCSCATKYQIDRFIRPATQPTYLFDRVVSTPSAVIAMLSNDAAAIINENTLCPLETSPTKYAAITISGLNQFKSIHDMPKKFTQEDAHAFMQKYHRRHARLISLIKDATEPICFVYHGVADATFGSAFAECILSINPGCKFLLATITGKPQGRLTDHHINFDFHQYPADAVDQEEWKKCHIDWGKIFEEITVIIASEYSTNPTATHSPLHSGEAPLAPSVEHPHPTSFVGLLQPDPPMSQ
jgi:hypothetical protein